jgi:mRNA-degrading endonuclease RelE of RelBE toxin-antitoxin system
MTGDEWTWEFRPTAADSFDGLDPEIQRRIVEKLDEIVANEWREPSDYVEPLSGMPHGKIRVGEYRLGANADREEQTVVVYDVQHRSGAYDADDD